MSALQISSSHQSFSRNVECETHSAAAFSFLTLVPMFLPGNLKFQLLRFHTGWKSISCFPPFFQRGGCHGYAPVQQHPEVFQNVIHLNYSVLRVDTRQSSRWSTTLKKNDSKWRKEARDEEEDGVCLQVVFTAGVTLRHGGV